MPQESEDVDVQPTNETLEYPNDILMPIELVQDIGMMRVTVLQGTLGSKAENCWSKCVT